MWSRNSKPRIKQAEAAEAACIIEETGGIVAVGVCVGVAEAVAEVVGVLLERLAVGIATTIYTHERRRGTTPRTQGDVPRSFSCTSKLCERVDCTSSAQRDVIRSWISSAI